MMMPNSIFCFLCVENQNFSVVMLSPVEFTTSGDCATFDDDKIQILKELFEYGRSRWQFMTFSNAAVAITSPGLDYGARSNTSDGASVSIYIFVSLVTVGASFFVISAVMHMHRVYAELVDDESDAQSSVTVLTNEGTGMEEIKRTTTMNTDFNYSIYASPASIFDSPNSIFDLPNFSSITDCDSIQAELQMTNCITVKSELFKVELDEEFV
jgi:hypothetical protein